MCSTRSEPLHILHLETGEHLYGGALQVLYLMKGLAEKRFRNTLVCAKGSAISDRAGPFADVFEIPMKGDMDPRVLFHLLRAVFRLKPHIVHVHSRRGADLWGGVAAKLTHTKALVTRRVDNAESVFLARLKYGLYNRIITISKEIERVLLSEGIPENKIACVPSAVDYHRYEGTCDRKWFLSEFGLNPEAKAVGVVAQLIPRKGHRFLIEAANQILRVCPETEFLFFGRGPLRNTLESLCLRHRLEKKVHFAGFRKDMEKILPCLHLIVHPATKEGLGVSLLQASAAGVPIVAFKAGGVPEVVRDGRNGHLVHTGDVDALARLTISLLKHPQKARELGRYGRNMVMEHFSIDAMVKGNSLVYDQMCP